MRICRTLALAVIGLLLPACSGADLLNSLVPDTGYRVTRDIAYGEGPRRRLDLYIPESSRDAGPAPLVLYFYGGGWESGSKGDYRFVGQALATRGYAVAIPDYRLYPEVRYPAFLEDAAAAVAWVRASAPDGGTGRKVYLVGHSAGAYIAAMLTLDDRWLAAAGQRPCAAVAATVGLAGPYDFLPLRSATLKAIFGPEPSRPASQPVHHVDGDEPPMLLVTGSDDTTVLPRNSERLAARIAAAGGRVDRRDYARIGHIALAASLASPLQGLSPALDDIDGFLRRHPVDDAAGCRTTGSSSSASPASRPAPSHGG